jgi:hypothetical protein
MRIPPRPHSHPLLLLTLTRLVIVEDLVGIIQDRIDDPHLPTGILDIRARVRAHEGRTEDDGKVGRVHPVCEGVFLHAIQVQGQGAQGSVVGVGKGVDDGVEGVSSNDVVFVFYARTR